MLSTMGIGDLVCRLVIGPLVTVWKLDVTKVYAVSQLVCAIAIASFPVVVNGIQMIIQGFLFSVTFGCQCLLLGKFSFLMNVKKYIYKINLNCCSALVPRSLFGSQNLNRIFGITMFFGGIGILIGPPIVSSLFNQHNWVVFLKNFHLNSIFYRQDC